MDRLRVALVGATLALAAVGPALAQAKKKPTPAPAPRTFKLELEQDGGPVAIKDHEAVLRRAPFALYVTMPDKDGVFVSASFEPELYETARSGRAFGPADFRVGISGAEGVANASRDLFIRTPADATIHFWDCAPGEDSRFDQLVAQGPGCRGRRGVENFYLGEEVPVAKFLRRPLHLVFFRGALNTQGVVKETGRDWLKLYLDTAPEALKAAVGGHFQTLLDDKRPTAERVAALKALAAMGRDAIVAMDAVAHETAVKAREAGAVADLRTIISAEMAYASGNGGLYDGPPCLIEPQKCRPKFTGAPFLQFASLETRNGYKKLFLPGPAASKDEIKRAKASPSSLKDFVVVAWPETFGETGYRAFCADSSGRLCFVEGPSPPAKGGRCEGCQPLP